MRGKTLKASPLGEAQHVVKPPSAREVPRRGGGREPCRSPKYFGQPHSSLPHRLRAEPPRRGGQGETVGAAIGRPPALRQPLSSRVDDEHRPLHYSINAPRAQPLPRHRASRPAQSGRHLAGAWRPIRPYTKNLQAQPPKAVENISKTLAHFRFYANNKDKPLGARCALPKM